MTLFDVAFVLLCVSWPLIGVGLLFIIDGRAGRDMLLLIPELLRALIGLPYDPKPETPTDRRLDRLIGGGFVLAGIIAGLALLNTL